MPRPLRNATTGASISSASSRISSRARIAPLPTKIIGVLLPAISAAAALMRSVSGCGAQTAFPETSKCRELIRHFVQMAAALAEILRRHLSGQAEHRFVRAEGGQQSCTRIEHARAGHHAEHAGPSGGSRIAIGHVAASLLVAGADHLQLCLLERVE